MEISFNLPYVFNPTARRVDNACALNSLLNCLISLNLKYLRFHPAPSLYESGVRYGRTVLWEPIPALYLANKRRDLFNPPFWVPTAPEGQGKQRGDCKSLTAAMVAQYMHKGEKARAVFRWAERKDNSGELDFHILVQTLNGYHDPSRHLGMGENEFARFYTNDDWLKVR